MTFPERTPISVGRDLLEKVIAALDTADGCLMLVAADRKPIDLAECREEITDAYDDLCALMDEHTTYEEDSG